MYQGPAHAFDVMARLDSPVHRVDPRAKLVTTVAYIALVMSFGRHELSALAPFALFPLVLFSLSGLPAGPLLKALAAAAPFAVAVGMFNPLFDRAPAAQVGALTISGGWLSFVSILLRFTLTVGAALMLVATTGMYRTAMALERLWVPRVFVLQLLFVYRYLFVLLDEAGSLDRARSLRSFGRPASVALFGRLAGGLLLRTLDRAQRIDQAMRGRGFDGTVRFLGAVQIKRSDVMFCVGWCVLFVLFRLVDVSQLLGIVLTGGTP